MREPLTEEHIIHHGGWHPRFARVLLIAHVGTETFAIVDGNGNGAELEFEQWLEVAQEWTPGASNGIGPLDHPGPWSTGWVEGTGYVVGGAMPGKEVGVEWRSQFKRATANDYGVWLCLFPHQPPPRRSRPPSALAASWGYFSEEEQKDWRPDWPRVVDVN